MPNDPQATTPSSEPTTCSRPGTRTRRGSSASRRSPSRTASPAAAWLDVACGTGKRLAPLLERGYVVIACDASSAMVARAWPGPTAARRSSWPTCATLPVLGAFDLVTCLDDVLCHLLTAQDVLAALEGIRRNLAPSDVALPAACTQVPDAIAGDDRHVVL